MHFPALINKFYRSAFIAVALVFCHSGQLYAAQPHRDLPFKVKASAAVLMNVKSGQVLCSQNPDSLLAPASLTKIMTLYLAYDAVDNGYVVLDDKVTISEKSWKTGGSKMFLEVNTKVPLELLLQGIAVVSANDACVAVAEYLAGVEEVFVEKMNSRAVELGLTHTSFKNSHGLPHDGQKTTAHDIALLAYNYLMHHPEALRIHSIKEMTFNNITQRNRNGLLWLNNGVDGLKTGWFSSAGFHIVATAARENDRFIAVVMGAKSERQRENIAMQLLNYGFRNFTTQQIIENGEAVASVSVWKGRSGSVPIGTDGPVFVTVPRESSKAIIVEKEFEKSLFAPLEQGQRTGILRIKVNGRTVKTKDLVALETVGRAGPFKRMSHGIVLLFIFPPYWGVFAVLAVVVVAVLCRFFISRSKKNNSDISGFGTMGE